MGYEWANGTTVISSNDKIITVSNGKENISLTLSSDEKQLSLTPDFQKRTFPVQELIPGGPLEVDIPNEYMPAATANPSNPAAAANPSNPAAR